MTKVQLSSDSCPASVGSIGLDDDCYVDGETDVSTSPLMTILTRVARGVDGAGDRVYGWQALEQVPVALYETRREVDEDGISLIRVKVEALYAGVDLPSTIAVRFEFRLADDPIEYAVYRITSVEQNGMRLFLEGERVLDTASA